MSLRVDNGNRTGRSRSPGGYRVGNHERSRSRGPKLDTSAVEHVRMPSPPAGYSYDHDLRRSPRPAHDASRSDNYHHAPQSDESYQYRRARAQSEISNGHESRASRSRRDRDSDSDRDRERERDTEKDRLSTALSTAASYLPSKYSSKLDGYSSKLDGVLRDSGSDRDRRRVQKEAKKAQLEDDLAYGGNNRADQSLVRYSRHGSPSSSHRYGESPDHRYEKFDDKHVYDLRDRSRYDTDQYDPRPVSPAGSHRRSPSSPGVERKSSMKKTHHYSSSQGNNPRYSANSVLTVEPVGDRNRSHSPHHHTKGRASLTVNTLIPSASSMSLANAPPSPLLESYHGTYQSMSPMPSPLLLPVGSPAGYALEPLSPGLSEDERGEKKKRRARFHDPVDDTRRLANALQGDLRAPDTTPLIEILPGLTHRQVMELRAEYKQLVKTGSERKGVNIAKHIRARLKDEDPLLMKACYAVALGQWESEAYWANFWYHGDKTRRELLIESIMGRDNDEIRAIKEGFSDKKYRDSLTQCMKTELKEDKFKKAVLLALEERRMEDKDDHGHPLPVDHKLIEDDEAELRHIVKREKGGETAMITIIVTRSDAHLREVLQLYERRHKGNFARDALQKSNNLVGEVLAHILNGVINRPVRDAMLLNHALSASRKDNLRRELLISRLVRYHWDRNHMAAIKHAYHERYGVTLNEAIRDSTSEEWGLFCRELIVARMPDEVRRFEKVEFIN